MVRCGDWGTAVVVSPQQGESKKWSRFGKKNRTLSQICIKYYEFHQDLSFKKRRNLFLLLSRILFRKHFIIKIVQKNGSPVYLWKMVYTVEYYNKASLFWLRMFVYRSTWVPTLICLNFHVHKLINNFQKIRRYT